MPPPDGRRARGDRRRREILEATLRVVERDGVAGVSHRSVAREARVPTTSTTYYYATLDDLLIATLTWSAEQMAATFREVLPLTPADVARFIADAAGRHRGRTLAEYELYLLAARRPELRAAARRWISLMAEVAGDRDPVALRAVLAGLDGLLIQSLIADFPPMAQDLEPVVSLLMLGG